ncbi:hypothetical protein F3Y22_tig00110885pilonHSYRG00012 [Hibiscus syriacus]|uniref:beta-glucosidase n=1 Tax=Hibiscus syriacus TaxID=106335 RepID=A0A6A2ZK06_HIBSY|nr:hypothetical protein F3Y22_tig00110885pilonHSYRG00012 [Hibiscus syriacus]
MGRFSILTLGFLLLFCLVVVTESTTYLKYKDPKQHVGVRIKYLMKRMTLAEKIGQITQIEHSVATNRKPYLPGIPMMYGIDTIHGHNNVYKETIFPYNVGLGVCRNPRWGRCYKSYSEDLKIVQLMTEIIPSLQGELIANSRKGIHFVAGNRNGKKMHANRELITGYLKNKLKFRGFVISDWQGLDRITSHPHANYSYSVEVGVGAGIDMVVVPFSYTEFVDDFTYQVKHNIIPMSRMDGAEKRIMRNNGKSADKPLLPLPKKTTKILVAGSHADYLGSQCGCRTITWKGLGGNILNSDSTTQVVYNENPRANYVKSNKFSYAIVVVGGPSYAKTLVIASI